MRWKNRHDFYYRKAKSEGYRSRAAFKLKQIIEKFKIIREGDVVVDLGAAPGGWLQVARKSVGKRGFVLGVDICEIEKLPWKNVKTARLDVTAPNITDEIQKILPRKADVLLSDLSPKVTGIWELDHARQIFLSEKALEIALKILRERGNAVIKVFQGEMMKEFIDKVETSFKKVRLFKPPASRKGSAEIYVIGFSLKREFHKSSQLGH